MILIAAEDKYLRMRDKNKCTTRFVSVASETLIHQYRLSMIIISINLLNLVPRVRVTLIQRGRDWNLPAFWSIMIMNAVFWLATQLTIYSKCVLCCTEASGGCQLNGGRSFAFVKPFQWQQTGLILMSNIECLVVFALGFYHVMLVDSGLASSSNIRPNRNFDLIVEKNFHDMLPL